MIKAAKTLLPQTVHFTHCDALLHYFDKYSSLNHGTGIIGDWQVLGSAWTFVGPFGAAAAPPAPPILTHVASVPLGRL